MRIVSSRRIRVGGRTASPVGTSHGRLASREGVVLVLVSDDGVEGTGEASPLPGYSRETLEEVVSVLDGIHEWLGEPTSLERALSPASPLLAKVPAARFAVETAVLDLLGRRGGFPAHRVLGAPPPRRIPLSALLPAPCDPRTILAAREAVGRGIRTLKWKLGARPFEEELEALTRLREALGEGIEMRLDANGALGGDAGDRLRALAIVRPAYVEEPVGGAALLALVAARPAGVPIAADESLADPALADALLAHGGLGAVVVKPALLGFLRAREIALAASRRGVPVVVTHLFDGPVALAACAELALSLPSPAACGLDRHAGLAAHPAVAIPQLEEPGFVRAVDGAGLCIATPGGEAGAWRR